MQNSLVTGAPVRIERVLVTLATIVMIGCSGGGSITKPPPPVEPSGIITTFPASTAAAPFVVHCNKRACPSQTFGVSELGYTGLFAFNGSYGIINLDESFSAPAGVLITIGGRCISLFGEDCTAYKIAVRDSLGNSSTIYAQYVWN